MEANNYIAPPLNRSIPFIYGAPGNRRLAVSKPLFSAILDIGAEDISDYQSPKYCNRVLARTIRVIREKRLESSGGKSVHLKRVMPYFKEQRIDGRVYRWEKDRFLSILQEKQRRRRNAKPKQAKRAKVPKTNSNYLGIEIEFLSSADMDDVISHIANNGLSPYCQVKTDGSVNAPCENGSDCEACENGDCESDSNITGYEIALLIPETKLNLVKDLCYTIESELGGYVNKTCGLHVHLDMRQRNKNRSFYNLARSQSLLYSMVPKTRRAGDWCKWSDSVSIKEALSEHNGRYYGINVVSLSEHSTLEIRIHSGTINPEKIMNWCRLLVSIVDAPYFPETLPRDLPVLAGSLDLSPELAEYIDSRLKLFESEHRAWSRSFIKQDRQYVYEQSEVS